MRTLLILLSPVHVSLKQLGFTLLCLWWFHIILMAYRKESHLCLLDLDRSRNLNFCCNCIREVLSCVSCSNFQVTCTLDPLGACLIWAIHMYLSTSAVCPVQTFSRCLFIFVTVWVTNVIVTMLITTAAVISYWFKSLKVVKHLYSMSVWQFLISCNAEFTVCSSINH